MGLQINSLEHIDNKANQVIQELTLKYTLQLQNADRSTPLFFLHRKMQTR